MTDDREDEDRKAILARRSKLIALALGGLTSATGCYESHAVGTAPTRPDAEAPRRDAEPGPCLGAPLDDAGPRPCLEAPIDAGPPPGDAAIVDGGVAPTPCLTMPPPDPE